MLTSATSFAADTIDVDNNQDLTTPYTAQSTVNAGDVSETHAASTALGNTLSVDYVNGNVVVINTQTVNANGTSIAIINMDSADTASTATSSTFANSATITTCCDVIDATNTQTTISGNTVNSQAGINMSNWAMNPSVSSLATGNTTSVETTYGTALNNALTQNNGADINSDAFLIGGLVADNGTVISTAIGNSGFAGGQQTTLSSAVDQTNTANTITATASMDTPSVEDAVLASSAIGNNFTIENAYGYAQSYVSQNNSALVSAQTDSNADYWEHPNSATALAYGNSNIQSNIGSDLYLDNIQINTGGGVESTVTVTGGSTGGVSGDGWSANATAIGNAVSAYVCDTCQQGGIQATNSQTNSANVTATSTVNTGNGGIITSAATAIGNSATFQSSGNGG